MEGEIKNDSPRKFKSELREFPATPFSGSFTLYGCRRRLNPLL
jgi:hypothetical protein